MNRRFKMSFNNSGYVPVRYNNLAYNISAKPASASASTPAPVFLNSPMVERIHKAKPGCSACGKKVA
jgi:hypothetical protein